MSGSQRTYIPIGIVLFGLALRFWGVGFGLPGLFSPDESAIVHKAVAMGTGDLNPHAFYYPTFYIYLVAALFGLIFIAGWALGLVNSAADFQGLFFFNPTIFYLADRCLSALFGTMTIPIVWKIGQRCVSKRGGYLAALFLSACYLHVRESHFGVTNISLTFWMSLSLLFLTDIMSRPAAPLRYYILTGIAWGLAISTKYTGVYFAFPFLFGHLRRLNGRVIDASGLREHGKILVAGVAMALSFFLTSPFVFLDYQTFQNYYRMLAGDIFGGISIKPLISIAVSLRYGVGLPMLILSGVGAALAFRRKTKVAPILIAYALGYALFLINTAEHPTRYLDPLLPVLCLLAAGAYEWTLERAARPKIRFALGLLMAGMVIGPPLRSILLENAVLCKRDTRNLAADWIQVHAPTGTKLAIYGSVYWFPPLAASRDLIEEQFRFVTTLGKLRGGNFSNIFASPRSFKAKLAQPGYPAAPNYYIFELVDSPENVEIPKTWILSPEFSIDRFKTMGIRYVVFAEHPALPTSPVGSDLLAQLENRGRLRAEFNPLKAGADHKNLIYDGMAMLVPVSGHARINRPGPRIRIYEI